MYQHNYKYLNIVRVNNQRFIQNNDIQNILI